MMSYVVVSSYGIATHTIHTCSICLTTRVAMDWITWKCGETQAQGPRGSPDHRDCKKKRFVVKSTVHSGMHVVGALIR